MRKLLIMLSFALTASYAWCDNTVGGEDMPWDDDDPITAIEAPDANTIASPAGTPAADGSQHKAIYDLQGRRVETPQPGHIYIIGGKKVVFRQK